MAAIKGLGSAGTKDTKVQRIEEGLPAFATVDNPTANPASINTFDAGIAGVRGAAAIGGKGDELVRASAQIDTQWEANGLSQADAVKRGAPGAW